MPILLEILLVAVAAVAVSRLAPEPWRGRLFNALKLYLTVRMVWLLALWPIKTEAGELVPAWHLILDVLRGIDAATFWTYAAIGAAIRFSGVMCSMLRWQLVLLGQRIELPFRHIFGAFLIGRAIGFFLPSTAGLDAYKLYDAARFSGRTVEVTAGTVLEKVLGVTGIFLTFLVALPFGFSIFGENATLVATITVPMAAGIIGALLVVLWFPGLVQWVIEHLPIPGKARLEGVVLRISNAAAAYRDKKLLVLVLLFLSFMVHFTTAAMYYFMALAVGAGAKAVFWPIVFGSSIQIFATVIGPTIGGLGVREAAQLLTLGALIGPGIAIVSATLGFWVGEVPTLFGFAFWMLRGKSYRPPYCRVNGEQVDYEEAAKAAVALEMPEDKTRDLSELPSLGERARVSAGFGMGAGIVSGLLIGVIETFVIAQGGFGGEAQVLWYGPLSYAALFGFLGLLGGLALSILPMDLEEIRGWTPSLGMLAMLVPFGLAITLFRVRRDVFLEQMPPFPVLLAILGGFGLLAVFLFFVGRFLFQGRLGWAVKPLPALGLAALVGLIGWGAMQRLLPQGDSAAAPTTIPSQLASAPNLILIMVDTLRADHLSCYGSQDVTTPNMCSLAEGDGTRYTGFSHASWTKPATATLLTSLLPSSHQATGKTSRLSSEIQLISEVLKERGYATGGVVSNINLAESFGFDQGYDEYHYLAPDYLFGAQESSSKLILYQIGRKIWFMGSSGLRFGDFYQDSQVVNEVTFDWLDRYGSSRFFLFLHYMDPHDPYLEHPYDGYGIAKVGSGDPDPSQAEELRRLYIEEINYLDENVGRLIEKLKQLGVYENSIIMLTSDHGEEFYDHGGWWHGTTLYEEQIHVPLLVKWRNGAAEAPPVVTSPLARLIDVAPTLAARGGAEIPAAMQGIDLVSPISERRESDRVVFAEEELEGNVLRALRTEQWKLIEANEGNPRGLPTVEVFDIDDDPGETRDVYADTSEEVIGELRSQADAAELFAEGGAVGEGESSALSREECEKLRVLGYVDSCD